MHDSKISEAFLFPLTLVRLLYVCALEVTTHPRARIYGIVIGTTFVAAGQWLPEIMCSSLDWAEWLWQRLLGKVVIGGESNVVIAAYCEWFPKGSDARCPYALMASEYAGLSLTFAGSIAVLGFIPCTRPIVIRCITVVVVGLAILGTFEVTLTLLYEYDEVPAKRTMSRILNCLGVTRFDGKLCDVVYPQASVLVYLLWQIHELVRETVVRLWKWSTSY